MKLFNLLSKKSFILNLNRSPCFSVHRHRSPSVKTYETEYRRSIEQPDEYWGEKKALIHWYEQPKKILDKSNSPFEKW